MVGAAGTVHEFLHAAFQVVFVQAGRALFEVLPDLVGAGVLELVVDEHVHPLQDLAAVDVVVLAAAHDSSFSAAASVLDARASVFWSSPAASVVVIDPLASVVLDDPVVSVALEDPVLPVVVEDPVASAVV